MWAGALGVFVLDRDNECTSEVVRTLARSPRGGRGGGVADRVRWGRAADSSTVVAVAASHHCWITGVSLGESRNFFPFFGRTVAAGVEKRAAQSSCQPPLLLHRSEHRHRRRTWRKRQLWQIHHLTCQREARSLIHAADIRTWKGLRWCWRVFTTGHSSQKIFFFSPSFFSLIF